MCEKLVDNTVVLVLSRLAMIITPILLGAVVWLGPQWLDARYARQSSVNDINTRLHLVERGQQDQGQFQRDMLVRLDRMQESINTLSTSIATQVSRQ